MGPVDLGAFALDPEFRRWREYAMHHKLDYGAPVTGEFMSQFCWDRRGFVDSDSKVRAMLTYDYGMYVRQGVEMADSTPFSNPDFNQCLHLSLSDFTDWDRHQTLARCSTAEINAWIRRVFTVDEERMLVKAFERGPIFHARLFYDRRGRAILPQGEVYDRR